MFNKEENMSKQQWEKQSKIMEQMVRQVEGVDDRSYTPADDNKKTK